MSNPPAGDAAESRLDTAAKQLAYEQDQLSKGVESVRDIMQNIFWAFGVGILAATKWYAAIAIVPIFWTAWLLYALQRTSDSNKHLVYARWLEEQINISVGVSDKPKVLRWNTELANHDLDNLPRINVFNAVYWILLNAGAWVGSAIYFAHLGHWKLAIAVTSVFIIIYIGIGIYSWRTRDMVKLWSAKLKEGEEVGKA